MFGLGAACFELKLVSSIALARTREALRNSWDRNDPKDAQVIPRMPRIGAIRIFHDPLVAGMCDIQELSKTFEMVARAKTELWHRILTHCPPLYFPEADRFHRGSRGDWFLAFLEIFIAAHEHRHGQGCLHRGGLAGGRPSRRQSRPSGGYLETSKTSVGVPAPPDSDAIRMFRLVLAQNLVASVNVVEILGCRLAAVGHAAASVSAMRDWCSSGGVSSSAMPSIRM